MTRYFASGNGSFAPVSGDAASSDDGAGLRFHRISHVDLPALNSLALRSLVLLFDNRERLFCDSIILTKTGLQRGKSSGKLTAIALLGLQRLAESGTTHEFDMASIGDAVWKDRSWVKGIGDIGLLMWLTATYAPDRLGSLFDEYDFGTAINAYPDGRETRTTSLSWFLAGLAHAQLACRGTSPDLTDVAVEAYHLLQENQGEDGIFGHAGPAGFLGDVFYSRFGTISDQVYAIYALSKFARAFQIEEPLASALNCANSICALQGGMGQWWYLYDKRTCRVVNRYPVLSMHQDGTIPACLLALGEATGRDFHQAIWKGLSWLAGANEVGDDLRDSDRTLIWGSIGLKGRGRRYWEAALNCLGISHAYQGDRLTVRYEARPDHFGWLLYAFGDSGLP